VVGGGVRVEIERMLVSEVKRDDDGVDGVDGVDATAAVSDAGVAALGSTGVILIVVGVATEGVRRGDALIALQDGRMVIRVLVWWGARAANEGVSEVVVVEEESGDIMSCA